MGAVGGLYAGAGRCVANSAGIVHVAKREAEADPYVVGYGGYAGFGGYHGMGYSAAHHVATPHVTAPVVAAHHGAPVAHHVAPVAHHVAPVAHHVAPVVSTAHHVAPIVAAHHVAKSQVSPSASLTTVGAAPAAVPAIGGLYAGAGRYVANSAGVVHAA